MGAKGLNLKRIYPLLHASVILFSLTATTGSALSQAQPVVTSSAQPIALFHDTHPAMGTEFTLDLYAPNAATAQQWMQLSFDEIDRIEALLSNYQPSSELSRISREAGDRPITTDPETFAFLQTAFGWSERSNGSFDITVGPLMRAWGFFFHEGRIPQQSELDALHKATGWRNVQLDATTRTVFFANRTPMELDPGSIGKGYAVDRIVAILHEHRVSAALISAGSSTIYALGAPPGMHGWPVRLPDPAHPGGNLGTIELHDTSLSTGACTQKFFLKDGHRYCHILDPHTMRPVEDMLQTSVIAPSATDSDALSTVAFVMGADAATPILTSCKGCAAVIVSGSAEQPKYSTIQWPTQLQLSTAAQPERK